MVLVYVAMNLTNFIRSGPLPPDRIPGNLVSHFLSWFPLLGRSQSRNFVSRTIRMKLCLSQPTSSDKSSLVLLPLQYIRPTTQVRTIPHTSDGFSMMVSFHSPVSKAARQMNMGYVKLEHSLRGWRWGSRRLILGLHVLEIMLFQIRTILLMGSCLWSWDVEKMEIQDEEDEINWSTNIFTVDPYTVVTIAFPIPRANLGVSNLYSVKTHSPSLLPTVYGFVRSWL